MLAEVNALMSRDNPQSMFVTACFCIVDPRSGEVVYANAGHPSPLLVGRDGSVEEIGLRLATWCWVFFRGRVTNCSVLPWKPGELFFMYTDGVTEAASESGEEFGEDRLLDVLSGTDGLSAAECSGRVLEAVREFAAGREQSDDITCLALRRES